MAAAQRPDVHGVPGSLVGLQPVGPRAGGIDHQGRGNHDGRIVFLWLNQ